MKTGKVPFWRKNIGLKILALSFSIFLWFFVVGEEKAEVSLSIPLEIVNMPNNMVISNEFPGSIDVRVYGPRSLLRDLANRPMNREIDLAGATAGKVIVRFSPETIKLPRGVQVTRIQPSHINLFLEPLVRREVPIKSVIKGELAPDFELTAVFLEPSTVVITGLARETAKVSAVGTQPIDISGFKSDMLVQADLNLEKARFKVVGETHLKAYFKIHEKRIEKEFHVPILISGNMKARISPQKAAVLLRGPSGMLRNLKADEIRAVVKLEGVPPGKYIKQLDLKVKSGLEPVAVEPNAIAVTIPK